MKKTILLIAFLSCLLTAPYAQKVLIKNNVLYDLTTSPNIGLEFRTSQQTSFSLHGGYNPFKFSNGKNENGRDINSKLKHWSVMPEFKYWFCKAFERNYIGLHTLYSEYNMEGIPLLSFLEDNRYKGVAYGGGISYGHQWALGGRWGLELSLGGGFLHLEYDKYNCGECQESLGKYTRNYWGLTKASIAILFFIQ